MNKFGFVSRFLTRLIIGDVFIHSGWGKLQHLEKVIDFFTSLGIPAPEIQAPIIAALEFVCGLFVLFGFMTRWVSIPLCGIMTVALLTAKRGDINGIGELLETSEFLYLILMIWLITDGGGKISVDGLLARKGQAKKK